MPERARNVADHLLARLAGWGVRRVFGYAGDGNNGLMGALRRRGEVELVTAPHEELSALMACAYAKLTGELGVCTATSGPGAIHLLNGLYDARLDHQPVLAIVGQQPQMAMGGRFQQEVDLLSLFKDVASAFVHVVGRPEQVRHLVDRAARIALEDRTVTALIVPRDVQQLPAVEEAPHEHGTIHSGSGRSAPEIRPREDDLRRAAEVLNAGERVAMLVGAGALGATDEVLDVAEALGAGIAKALLGKAAVPDDLPFVTGSVGWLGTRPSHDLMERCDTLLVVGASCPYAEAFPKDGRARGVQIDVDGRMMSLRYPMEVNLQGDAAATLRALRPLLRARTRGGWRAWIEGEVRAWWDLVDARARQPADPVNPQLVFTELSARLPDDAVLVSDSGTSTLWIARNVRLRRGMRFLVSGTLATMGCAIPYALAAKLTHPELVCVAAVGDGAMQMNGNDALVSVARAWRAWKDPRLVVAVLNNRDLAYVSWEQRALDGEPRYPASQDVPDFPYARYAELLGLGCARVERPEDVAPAWDAALAAERPFVLEFVTDPDVPPLPASPRPKVVDALESALEEDARADHVREQLRAQGYAPARS